MKTSKCKTILASGLFLSSSMQGIHASSSEIEDYIKHNAVLSEIKSNISKERIEEKQNNLKNPEGESLEGSVTSNHLKQILGKQYNRKDSLEVNVERVLNGNLSTSYKGLKVKRIPSSEGRTYLEITNRDKKYFSEQIAKMIELEKEYPKTISFYTGMNSVNAAYQDIYQKLNEVFKAEKFSSGYRFGWKQFDKAKDAKDLKEIMHINQDKTQREGLLDHTEEFRELGICGGLSPLQNGYSECPYSYWSTNQSVANTDLLPFILESLELDKNPDDQLIALMKKVKNLSLDLGGRMKQILLAPADLDKYGWISIKGGKVISTMIMKLDDDTEEGVKYEETSIPSEIVNCYKLSPSSFLEIHLKKNKDTAINEIKEDTVLLDVKEITHLGGLQYRLLAHPELMLSNRIYTHTYYSNPDVTEKHISEYREAIEQITQELVERWYKKGNINKDLKDTPFARVISYRNNGSH